MPGGPDRPFGVDGSVVLAVDRGHGDVRPAGQRTPALPERGLLAPEPGERPRGLIWPAVLVERPRRRLEIRPGMRAVLIPDQGVKGSVELRRRGALRGFAGSI